MSDLTTRQRDIFVHLYEQTRDTGVQPSIPDLGARFGIASKNGIVTHLKALTKKGYIGRADGHARAIRFLRRPDGREFHGFADK